MVKDINKRINELEQKIEELKAVSNKTKILRTLESYTDAEKIEKFNEFFTTASETMQSKIDGEYHEDNDDSHYAWEQIMNLLGKDVWDVWNKLPNSYDR
jgi:cell fate (sporulation/competence/biofilm development) regulator YlbF (YheA/YmcA/DUF963 family)